MRLCLVVAAVALFAASATGRIVLPRRSLVEVATAAADDCRRLQNLGADVIDVRSDVVRCLATAEQIAAFRCAGLAVTVVLEDYTVPDPGAEPSPDSFYHTYEQLRDSLTALALRHPDICRFETLGFSVENRLLMGLRISDNIGVRENEPRCRLDGNIHGNEKLSCEVPLYAAYVLADSYGLSPRLTALVNSIEVLIVPMVNPDGAVANDHYNANDVDLNRDFGYMWDAWGNSPDWFSQPETRALRLDCERNRYAMSISYHTGGRLVIYPWMYTPVPTADDQLFKRLVFAYHLSTGYDTIRSYRWYQTHGQSFDSRYGLDGTLEVTTELRDASPPAESIGWYCLLNREAILSFLETSLTGIHGTVTDATSGLPVSALVRVGPLSGSLDWFVYSSAENGDFHRPLPTGTYSLHVSANGYEDTLVTDVVVQDSVSPVVVDVGLRPAAAAAARAIVCVQQNDSTGLVNQSLTHWALGMPDVRSYSMSFGGRLVLDMGPGSEIIAGPGPDLAVVEYPDAADTIHVSASRAWNGPWTLVGSGVGTCSLDLAGSGIDTVRYLLVRDGGHRANGSPTAGYDLDAVVALGYVTGLPSNPGGPPASPGNRAATIARGVLMVPRDMTELPGDSDLVPRLALVDATGRKVKTLRPGANDVRALAPGIYFVRREAGVGHKVSGVTKVVIQ